MAGMAEDATVDFPAMTGRSSVRPFGSPMLDGSNAAAADLGGISLPKISSQA